MKTKSRPTRGRSAAITLALISSLTTVMVATVQTLPYILDALSKFWKGNS